jgi:hypothetical protein
MSSRFKIWQSVHTHDKKPATKEKTDNLDFIKILNAYVLGHKLASPHFNYQLWAQWCVTHPR